MRPTTLAAVAAVSLAGLLFALPSRGAYTPPAEGTALAVATDHAEASRAALDALQNGGNAVDGAVAAALALGVVNPSASGLGGGGFAIVWLAKEQRAVAVDFREVAPAALDPSALASPDKRGAAVGVPGEPAGLEYLVARWGKRSLAADAAFAVGLAVRGFPAGHHLVQMLGVLPPDRLRPLAAAAPDLMPGGAPVGFRGLVRRPDLARSIARLGVDGAKPFYTGDIAQRIADAVRATGGAMTAQDLAAYRVKERAPLSRTIGGRTIVTMPAPSAGGLMLLEAATMYGADDRSPLKAMGFGSSAYLHTLAEVMRGAVADRVRLVGDPDVEPGVDAAIAAALDPAQLAARRAKILPDKTRAATEFKTREEGTSHLVVADAEGNVVSMTTTINLPFGARVVPAGTGILLNDELLDFSLPSEEKEYGLTTPGPNRARGGARPVSSMTPTIVLEGGAPVLALGGSGGRRIATEVTQAALARLVFGMDPSACVSAPRVFTNGKDTSVEPDIALDVRKGLEARGETVSLEPPYAPAVQMVAWERACATRLLAASDPRKAGFALAQ